MTAAEHPSDLPLPDYDALSTGDIEHRIRSLPADSLERLVDYEREHADRTPVLELLRARLDQLAAGGELSPGGESPPPPDAHRRGSPVTGATAGQPVHPPPHGTPWQPAKPKGDQRP